jgi:chromosome partitioning protein
VKKFIPVNQKGGVGKTMFGYHFAYFLGERENATFAAGQADARVLAVDFDEQRNATRSLAQYALPGIGASALFGTAPLQLPSTARNLVLLAADPAGLRAVEQSPLSDAELVDNLRARLAEIAPGFKYAVFDTPGSNSRLANAVLVASDVALIPCKIDPYSIDVAGEVLKRVAFIKSNFNPALLNLGILANEYDNRKPSQVSDLKELMGSYGRFMFPAFVSDRQSYRDASGEGVPVWNLKSGGRVKTAAREAGLEIRAVFKMILERTVGP